MTNAEKEILMDAEVETDMDEAPDQIVRARWAIAEFIDKVNTAFDNAGIEKPSEEVDDLLGHLEDALKWLDDSHMNAEHALDEIYRLHREQMKKDKEAEKKAK